MEETHTLSWTNFGVIPLTVDMPPNYQFFQFGFDLSQGPEKNETMKNLNNETNVATHCCIFVDNDKILHDLITFIIINIFSVRSVTLK